MTIPFSSIVFGDRFRKSYIDIDALAQSIETIGLIQPLAVDTTYRLLAGGRRYTALQHLIATGRMSPDCQIPVHIRADLNGTEDDEALAREIELEENLQRNNMTWQENALGIASLHEIKARRARRDDTSWTTAMTGKLFGQSRSNTDNALKLADALRNGDTEIASAENASTALAILTARRLREVEMLQEARRKAAQSAVNKLFASAVVNPQNPSGITVDAVYSGPTVTVNTNDIEITTPEQRRAAAYDEATRRLLNVECSLAYLASLPASSLDGVYCDPPYGIDDDNLDIRNIESTRAEHDRDENIALFEPTLRAVHRVLKPESYAVFWCDPEHFTTHLRHAEALGFRVLRWPLIAKKPIAKNGAAAFNPTKDYETLFVVAKTNAVLATRRPTSFVPWTWREREQERYVHPFKKPFSAHEFLLRTFWSPGARIHDPFCGEGSSVLAGHELGYDMTGSDCVADHIRRARLHFETLFA